MFMFLLCFLCESYAADNSGGEPTSSNRPSVVSSYATEVSSASSISALIPIVEKYVAQGIDPAKIWVVLDVDGTLTRLQDPTEDTGIVEERGLARSVVHYLWKLGAHLVFSSAWPSYYEERPEVGFAQTMQRLLKLNFGIDGLGSTGEGFSKGQSLINNTYFDFLKDGAVVSVHRAFVLDYYSRAKAFAPYFYDQALSLDMEILLFADDSVGPKSNTGIFQSDLREICPYSKLKWFHIVELDKNVNYIESLDVIEKLSEFSPKGMILSDVPYEIKSEPPRQSFWGFPSINVTPVTSDDEGAIEEGHFAEMSSLIQGGGEEESVLGGDAPSTDL
ncbi:MAG: hypothetical protein KF798_00920 [Candidatus Paracaedibacteraceae bacterium]|nr:hypothetical protein [Candidatus Paracaedibacteraceae bacterium]